MTKRFAIRNKPSKPVRLNNVNHEKNVGYFSLQDLIDLANEWGAPFEACEVELEYNGGYTCDCSVIFTWAGPERIGLFEGRMEQYEKARESYDAWAEEYKDEIAVELEVRKLLEEEVARVKAQAAVDKLTVVLRIGPVKCDIRLRVIANMQ